MMQGPPTIFLILFISGIVWVLLVFAVTGIRRSKAGRPIFRPHFPNATYAEDWISGGPRKGVLGFPVRGKACLWVVVTNNFIQIGAHFPFCIMPILSFDCLIKQHQLIGVETENWHYAERKM